MESELRNIGKGKNIGEMRVWIGDRIIAKRTECERRKELK